MSQSHSPHKLLLEHVQYDQIRASSSTASCFCSNQPGASFGKPSNRIQAGDSGSLRFSSRHSPQGCHCDQRLLLTWCLAFTLLLKLSPWPWLTFQQKINAPSSVSSLPLENNLSETLKGCVAEDYRASGGQDGTFPFSSTENQKHELPYVYKGENILLPETSLFNNGTIRRPI